MNKAKKKGVGNVLLRSGIGAIMISTLVQHAHAENCGYSVSTGTYGAWPNGYQAWVELTNNTAQANSLFSVYLDMGNAAISESSLADFQASDDGYIVTNPSWLQWQTIAPESTYRFQFNGIGNDTSVTPYLISIDGEPCDVETPQISLAANQTFFNESERLTLTADASDNVAVLKVVLEKDGQVIATVKEAPFTFDIAVDKNLNGRQHYKATAYDPSGNSASVTASVFVAVDNKFFGTAVDQDVEYDYFLSYFDQITPGNAGKWGSVESTRDEMNWQKLDTAYNFAKQNQLPFKFHTLVWGQQQPNWIKDLSPQEQLAEIEEWMTLAGERYPDAALVDVVNEPLHELPAYSEALGGAGVTGWDWVINAFEMARVHFPKAELILNDYNILVQESSTTNYLAVITLLQERGLLDGIGLQAHFLERADLAVLAANLDTLAATGLPIYISELDVSFANDSLQAIRFSEIFSLFWQHPSVVGVTHWGYLEGVMWRENGYLLNVDGSERASMSWLNCYLAGETSCPLPEYNPDPRNGDKTGLTLEAEEYDAGEGVLALGGQIAYVDDGDFIRFDRVVFNENWDSISLAFTKGNQDPGTVSVFLDEVDDSPEAELVLTNTGGWGKSATLSQPWLPTQGEHTVYFVFSGGYGVGNIDNIAFTAPTGMSANLIANGHFETDTLGWFSWDGTLSTSSDLVVSGDKSLLLSNRGGNGPAATSLTSVVTPGETYALSLWVAIAGADTAKVNITQKISCDGQATYSWLINPVEVVEGDWVHLMGDLVVPSCNLTDLLIYAEGPAGGIDLYLDHVSLRTALSSNILANGTFESGASGWFTWDGTLSASSNRAHSGAKSLLASNRSGNGPVATSLTSLVTPGTSYNVSFWVSIDGAESANVNLTQKIACDGDASYSWLVNPVTVVSGEWAELKGVLNVPNCNLTDLLIYAEGPAGGIDIYLDDATVVEPQVENLLANGDFETNTAGWFSWDGTLSTSSELAHRGSQSLLLSNRSGNGPAATNITSLVTPGKSYQVSFWVSIAGAESANVNLTQKVACEGEATYSWLASPVAVTQGEWTQITGTLDVPECNLTDLLIYAEGPAGGINLYVDDVVISP